MSGSHSVNPQRCVARVKAAGAWAQCPAPADPGSVRGWYCPAHEPTVPTVPGPARRKHPRLTRALAWVWCVAATVGAWLVAYGVIVALSTQDDPNTLGGVAYLAALGAFALTRPTRDSHRVNRLPDPFDRSTW